jgi:hypothetical protein
VVEAELLLGHPEQDEEVRVLEARDGQDEAAPSLADVHREVAPGHAHVLLPPPQAGAPPQDLLQARPLRHLPSQCYRLTCLLQGCRNARKKEEERSCVVVVSLERMKRWHGRGVVFKRGKRRREAAGAHGGVTAKEAGPRGPWGRVFWWKRKKLQTLLRHQLSQTDRGRAPSESRPPNPCMALASRSLELASSRKRFVTLHQTELARK